MTKTFRRWLLTGMILLSAVGVVWSNGQKEDPIRQARQLVSENRINDAILLLEQTVRDNPDRIQEAEALMRTIREIRGEYNVLFEQLIDNLVNNPDDIERTLAIIDQMEALDEFPNERVVQQVQDARIVAQLAYDRNLFNRRMDEARTMLQQGEYLAAVDVYTELDTLQRDRFESRGYGDIFVNSVNQAVTSMTAVTVDFRQALPPYRQAGTAILQQARQDVLLLDQQDLTPFFSEAARMASIVDRADRAAQDVAVIRSQVPLQFPDDPVDWYLNFQDMLARGRADYRGEEGFVYAVREAYRETVGQLADAGRSQTEQLLTRAATAADNENYQSAADRFATAVQTAALWEQAVTVETGIFDQNPPVDQVVSTVGEDGATQIVAARTNRRVSASLSDLSTTMRDFVARSVDRQADLFSLQSQIDAARATVDTLQSGRDDLETAVQPIQTLPAAARTEETRQRLADGMSRWQRAIARAMDRQRQLAVAISTTRTAGFDDALDAELARMQELAPLNEGVQEQQGEDAATARTVRYPDRALAGYREVRDRLAGIADTVGTARDELAAEDDYVLSASLVQTEQERLAQLGSRTADLVSRADAGIADAQDLIARAQQLQEEANQRIADTRAAISGFQVDAARNNYAAAREAFLASLELREDPQLREQSDQIIQQVGAQLQELENVLVVRRVRELITQAEELYNQDSYVAARDTLLAAQETWSQTNVDPNTEVERLLRLVTAALSLEEGRELSVTDPLYPILGNYLSIAREDYNRARQLFDAGQTDRANVLFDRAVENLRNVRDVRPLNWDARILELRIAQIRNASDFDQVFAARYEQAVNRLDQAGPLQVYSELEVLAEINPDYPGLQDQLRRLEIALNLRENPVDQARINQAAQLYSRAQQLANGTRDQAQVAVSLLEQAVDLNPRNSDAKFLLDQLRIRLGGQATVALNSADEQQYRRAETLFSQGRVLQALQITERLLAQGNNQNYPPLVDLRRRIALRLGI